MDHPRRYNVERSCVRCHERKVRCDKGTPCAACVRQNVVCQYPGGGRMKRRPQKASSTDLLARVEQLEQVVAELTRSSCRGTCREVTATAIAGVDAEKESVVSRGSPNPDTPESPPPTLPPQNLHSDRTHPCPPPQPPQPPQDGLLARDGQYINEHLLSRFLEHDKELKSVISSPQTDGDGAKRHSPLRLEGLLVNPLLMHTELHTLRPTRWQATQLWHTFLTRVDPVVKILHIPTAQAQIFAAINRPHETPADAQALLFAIYFAASTSLIPDDPIGTEIRNDVRRYQHGFEIALYHSSFLEAPTLVSLQAMAVYQTSLRYHNTGRSSWMLHGLTVRGAQSIGLHRDGKHFSLPPFECELRRRLWYHITTIEQRAAEDHGLFLGAQNDLCDTLLPANLDDQDLSRVTNHHSFPASAPRWTEMTFALITTEVNQQLAEVSRRTTLGGTCSPDKIARELRERLQERYLRYGDADIPIHRHGMLLAEVLMTKLAVYARLKARTHTSTDATTDTGTGTETDTRTHTERDTGRPVEKCDHETIEMACYALERGLDLHTDELLRSFRWLVSTYPQYHLLTYVLWQLCVHPTGPHVDRAWRCIDATFHPMESDPSWPDPGPKWSMVSQLRDKARRIRDASMRVVNPSTSAGAGAVPEAEGLELFDLAGWDINMLGFEEWSGH